MDISSSGEEPPKTLHDPPHMAEKHPWRKRLTQRERSTRELTRSEKNSLFGSNKYIRRLLSTPNVVSLSYTDEIRKCQPTGRKVLLVGVMKKLKRHEKKWPDIRVGGHVLLGKDLAVPVQVVEEGKIVLHEYSGGDQLKVKRRCVMYGTLGGWDKEGPQGQYRIFSCAHVMTGFDKNNIGVPVVVCNHEEEDFTNSNWKVEGQAKIKRAKNGTLLIKQDLAWAYAKKKQLSSDFKGGIGRVHRKRSPKKRMKVKIYGGHSGKLVRNLEVVDTDAYITKSDLPAICNKNVELIHQCYVLGAHGFDEGDSGGPVVDESTNDLVGIYKGSSQIKTYFTPILLNSLTTQTSHTCTHTHTHT